MAHSFDARKFHNSLANAVYTYVHYVLVCAGNVASQRHWRKRALFPNRRCIAKEVHVKLLEQVCQTLRVKHYPWPQNGVLSVD